MKITRVDSVPGGWRLTAERLSYYADGSSREETIHLIRSDVRDKTTAEIKDAIHAALEDDEQVRSMREEDV